MADNPGTCTCGQCYQGWLSPRMRERLEYSTELRYGLAKSLLDTQDGVPADITSTLPIDYAEIDTAFYYLPPEIRAKITSSSSTDAGAPSGDAIYRGYIAVFKVIKDLATAIQDDDKPRGFPTISDIDTRLAELRPPATTSGAEASDHMRAPARGALGAAARAHLAAFLSAGGSGEPALDCIVDRAREELSPLGRLYDAEKQYIDAVLDGGADGEPRVACANDLDFALVRVKLGLPLETRGVDVPQDGYGEDGRDPLSDEE
ncbi:hypothetical protein BD413DRAFT_485883 [Trametes elegans]|nr:hypothetical protein BD413DRAFT_485883 [Trametes elegans]